MTSHVRRSMPSEKMPIQDLDKSLSLLEMNALRKLKTLLVSLYIEILI